MADETGGLAPLLAGAGQTGTRAGLVHRTAGAQALVLHTMSQGLRAARRGHAKWARARTAGAQGREGRSRSTAPQVPRAG